MRLNFFIGIVFFSINLGASTIINVDCPASTRNFKLNTLIKDVIDRNPDLAATRFRIRSASIKVPRVQILDDPQLIVRSINNSHGSDFTPQMRYKLSQKFPFPGKLRLKGRIAGEELKFFKSEEITTHRELVLQAKKLYYQLFLNQVAQRINKRNKEIVLRFVNTARALYETGKKGQQDILKAHLEFQILDDELIVLERQNVTIVSMINAILNKNQGNLLGQIKENFSSRIGFGYEELEPIAIAERSELHGILARVNENKARAKLAKREYFPDVTVDFMCQDKTRINKQAWGVTVGINMPIWAVKKQRREKMEAKANILAYKHDLFDMKAQIRGRLKDVLSEIRTAEERIDLYKTGLIPKTIETISSYEASYRSGKESFLILLDTRRQLHDLELEYERVRANREIFLAELERVLGVPLEELNILVEEYRSKKRHLAILTKDGGR